jgi:Ca2+-binding EF-hand superfamily protein
VRVFCLYLQAGVCALGLVAATASQEKPQEKPRSKWIALRVHDNGTSRAAFRACDGNADDRLSIFEARQCLARMDSLEDREGFRQLDSNKDGQLSWPEFDRHFHRVCERGGSFRIRPVRPFQPPRRARRASVAELAALSVIQLGDKNGDRVLDGDELKVLLKEFQLPEGLGTQGLLLLDTDKSGTVNQKELLLLVQTVPGLIDLGRQEQEIGATRAGPLAGTDKDDDGEVSHQELGQALRLLDPALARWSRKVFADADTDKDGALGADEFATVETKR